MGLHLDNGTAGANDLAMLSAIRELLLPRSCAGCCCAGTELCADCEDLLVCARPTVRTVAVNGGWLSVHFANRYSGVAQRAILSFKRNGSTRLQLTFSQSLAGIANDLAHSASAGTVLVPIPSSRQTVERIGFHVANRLAQCVVREVPNARVAPVLLRNTTGVQKGRSSAQRLDDSVHHEVHRDVRLLTSVDQQIVLIDDVVTTGATMASAHRALTQVGCEVRGGMAIAATSLRHERK